MMPFGDLSALIALYREGRLLPFVGAGVSTSVTWRVGDNLKRGPTWRELVSEACRLLGFELPDLLRIRGTELQILEYFKARKYQEFAELRMWLTREMSPPDDALKKSPIHSALARLTKCAVIYTTNYDDFIERAFQLHGRSCMAIAIEAHIAEALKRGELTQVVKFHGDLKNPDYMVLSESDYERRLTLSGVMDYRFQSDILGRSVLFIGYSFRDWNVSYLFRVLDEQLREERASFPGPRGYITVADPSNFEIQLFRARNIEVIPLRGERLTEDTTALLEAIMGN